MTTTLAYTATELANIHSRTPSVSRSEHYAVKTIAKTASKDGLSASIPRSLHHAALLSVSPPSSLPKKAGFAAAPGHGTAAPAKGPLSVSGPQLPVIHNTSVVETMRSVLSGIDMDLCEESGENAFLVCDLGRVWARFLEWERELGGIVEPFFAVKCNPDPVIVSLMAKLGLGFDCASQQEISQVLSYGVNPDKIIYANPCKAASFIRHAAKSNVRMMTFDNADELAKIKRFHADAKMVLRILTDDSGSLCKLGLKFGAPLSEVRGLLEKAKELEVDVCGISFHVGSGCTNPALFADAVKRARYAFDVGQELGFDFDLLDIGGGFGADNFAQIAAIIRPALQEYFSAQDGVRVIAEPGRYFVAEAFEMATNIIARRGKPSKHEEMAAGMPADGSDSEAIVMYYINDGVYGSFNCTMFDHQVVHPKVLTMNGGDFVACPTTSTDETSYEACSIWGPTCDSIDCVSKLSYLPTEKLQVGDWLRWENMGAYTICAASQFNGFKQAKVVYCLETDKATELKIRRILDA